MPYVNIQVTKNNFTRSQKEEVIRGVTRLLGDVLGTSADHTLVYIDEVETDNFGIGGASITTFLENKAGDSG